MHIITQSCVLLFWMHSLTFVESKDCTLEKFINGPLFDSNFDTSNLEPVYISGKQVRVNCNVGFSGFFKLICADGEWVDKGSKCEPKSCGHPGDAPFADFELEIGNDFVFGSRVKYTCHKGYHMVSRSHRRGCLAEGWDGVIPVCEAQQCEILHVNANVLVDGDLEEANFGNVVRFRCMSTSEILVGLQEIYCNDKGEWSGEPPKCEEIKCYVNDIENGRVTGYAQEYKEHDILHFECNAGFKPVELRPAKCTRLGIRADWSPAPACELITCKLTLPPLEGTQYEPAFKSVFSPGDAVSVQCGDRFWISEAQGASAVVSCRSDGEWSLRPICKEVICENRRGPGVDWWNVYWGQQLKMGTQVSYDCRQGYKRTGGATKATCTKEGWTPKPLCQEVTCNRRDILNAEIVNPKDIYRYNERASYVCKEGYEGTFELTCRAHGWTGQSGCVEVTCNRRDILNAEIVNPKDIYRYNERASYVCKEGYEGAFELTCRPDGWIGKSGCDAKQCQHLDISNTDIVKNDKLRYRHGEKVKYQCRIPETTNFTIVCENGVWTGIQECSGCPRAEILHGFSVGPFKDKLYYTCDEGYKLIGGGWWAEAECHDGVWSSIQLCIEKTRCGMVPVIANVESKFHISNYEEGRSISITCQVGYRAQLSHLTCRNGIWDLEGKSLSTICAPSSKPCNHPPKVENAVVDNFYQPEFASGSVVKYQCKHNYTTQGDTTIRCTNGEWAALNIMCAPMSL